MLPLINYQAMPGETRVLVTGASGFIGNRLCSHLRRCGYPLRTSSRSAYPGGNDHWLADLAADACPGGLCEGIETVFHLAGKAHALIENRQDETEYRTINTEAVRKLLEAAQRAGVKRFIFFSSVKAVGDSPSPSDETADTPAASAYGQSKFAAEQLVLHGGYVPHPVIIRPCMVYGDTSKGNLPRMIRAIKRGTFPPIPEYGNRRSMVHVEDLVRAAMLAAENPAAAGQIYIVSDGQDYSTRQLYELIRTALGKPAGSWAIPIQFMDSLAKTGDAFRQSTGRRFILDSETLLKLSGSASYSAAKIRRELGFTSQYTLQQSLPDIISYLETS
ncbi:MAG: NAD-dependent epimerase/dehydratase family protein [Methylococcales bacterium]|nr:NAD-dependent epimerase/dehydratase family protein [Methylococcales bacterium]